jgi:hypothetical protein
MTANGDRDPFTVDEERALDALTLAWADEYDDLWVRDGEWGLRVRRAPRCRVWPVRRLLL